MIPEALRLQKLLPYLFAEIDRKKRELIGQGKTLIDLGIGDPDLPTPRPIIESLYKAAQNPQNHRYPPYEGLLAFRKDCAHWMEQRFSVEINPNTEVLALIGSKEGLAHFPHAFINPGDFALMPDPGYPVYANATILAGGTPLYYPLQEENRFQPLWSEIPPSIWKSIRFVFVNFPHNPTSATVPLESYRELVDRAKQYGFVICSDSAYAEQNYNQSPSSILQIPGAKEVAVDFFSLSKTYHMTGWRVGFAAGNASLLKALGRIKSNMDSGVFGAIQQAAIQALEGPDKELVEPSRQIYRYRRQLMAEGLRQKGYRVFDGGATFYLWVKNHEGMNSDEMTQTLLERGVVVTPGSGFGSKGEGYFRIALTSTEEALKEALKLF